MQRPRDVYDSSTGAVQMSHADQLIEIATELAMDAKEECC